QLSGEPCRARMLAAGGDLLVVQGKLGCLGAGDAHDAHDAHGTTLQESRFYSRGANVETAATACQKTPQTGKMFASSYHPAPAANEGAMSALRVMTFNIANGLDTEDDGENAWALRAPLNVQTIHHYIPDLIGFQQCDEGNLATYRIALPEYHYLL